MLEDLVAAAFNDAARRVESTVAEKMSGMTAGLGLPAGLQAAVLKKRRRPRLAGARPPDRGAARAARASGRARRSAWPTTCCSTTARAPSALAQALAGALASVRRCAKCNNFTEEEICALCRSPRRDASLLCVVETPADLAMVEQTLSYSGMYFVLMGRLSPLDGVGPRDIGLDRLQARVAGRRGAGGHPRHQLHQRRRGDRALHRRDAALARAASVSRIARGVPLGGELEYVDAGTISQALLERREI